MQRRAGSAHDEIQATDQLSTTFQGAAKAVRSWPQSLRHLRMTPGHRRFFGQQLSDF